jgi:fumarate hydratase, class II
MTQLWQGETEKAIEHFPISGERVPVEVVRMLARIKAEAARVNAELGLLDAGRAERIAAAAEAVAAGDYDDQFPIDLFQTGSGTNTNTNVNEVVSSLAGGDVHPNDHVNMGQSSNDTFPTSVHLAALDAATNDLLPSLDALAGSLAAKSEELRDAVKPGRTHLMDAVPVTLGQEFAGYTAQVREGAARVEAALTRVRKLPLGGTAVGTGLNAHPEFAARVRERVAAATGLELSPPAHPFEAQGARDALVELSGALKTVAVSCTKIANDIRWMGSGPRAGLGELVLPELLKGSSIMPGKVNPVMAEVLTQVSAQVIGNDTAITVAGLQGHFELNVFVPLMARNLLQSITYLAAACRAFAARCVDGITANTEHAQALAENTLVLVTALNPVVGYDEAAAISKEAAATGRTLREVALDHGVAPDVLDKVLDLRTVARGNGFADGGPAGGDGGSS